ncbi:hypothetical protein AXF42_Ash014195 [Apostasia shenzhenica]|uniref:Uncharacterized protein n=1 Tax=Apostasia shenzhenica TaxID=1088818 RepID=A0A2I0A166_9ASPA|nr:hypothetical protein AXF42_Ash014195 [Apostasia shenzhenica]
MSAVIGAARRTILRCTTSSKVFYAPARVCSSTTPSLQGRAAPPRLSRRLPSSIARHPAELSCVQSLMPLHSVTASSLLTSMLAVKAGSWGWLSEDFGDLINSSSGSFDGFNEFSLYPSSMIPYGSHRNYPKWGPWKGFKCLELTSIFSDNFPRPTNPWHTSLNLMCIWTIDDLHSIAVKLVLVQCLLSSLHLEVPSYSSTNLPTSP